LVDYRSAIAKVQEQQTKVQEQKSLAQKAVSRLQKKPPIRQQVKMREAMKASAKYRSQLSKQKKQKAQKIEEIKQYQKDLSEAETQISEQESALKKYEQEGYTIEETPEGGYKFSKKVVVSAPAPSRGRVSGTNYKALRQKKQNLVNQLQQITNAIARTRDPQTKIALKRMQRAVQARINAIQIPGEAQSQITRYETVTKELQKLTSLPRQLSFIERAKVGFLQEQLATIEPPTTKTYLTAQGITKTSYKQLGQLSFPAYTSPITGIKYEPETFVYGKDKYKDVVDWVSQRNVRESDVLRNQWQTKKVIPTWFKTDVENELKKYEDITRYSFDDLGIKNDYIRTAYLSFLYPENSETYFSSFNKKFTSSYQPRAQEDYIKSGYKVPIEFTNKILNTADKNFSKEVERLHFLGVVNPRDVLIRAIYEESIGLTGEVPEGKDNYELFLKPAGVTKEKSRSGGAKPGIEGYFGATITVKGKEYPYDAITVKNYQGLSRIDEGTKKVYETLPSNKKIEYSKKYGDYNGKTWGQMEREGYTWKQIGHTKEAGLYSPPEDYVGYTKEYIRKEMRENPLKSLASWVSSSLGPGILTMEDPGGTVTFGKSLISAGYGLVGDKEKSKEWAESALETQAKIRAQTHIPEYREQYYEEMHPAQRISSSFISNLTQAAMWPVTLPQTVVKYATGTGEWTDVGGRITTGKPLFLPDVGTSLYKASPEGPSGLIGATISEAITLGEAPAFEKAQKYPLETAAGTIGEILGLKAGAYGAQKFWTGQKTVKVPFSKASVNIRVPYGSQIRPAALGKGLVRGTVEGLKRPSFTGMSKTFLKYTPKVHNVMTKLSRKTYVGYKVLTRATETLGRVIKSPTMKKALRWAGKGQQEAFPRTIWGAKPFYRGFRNIYEVVQSNLPKAVKLESIRNFINQSKLDLKEIQRLAKIGKITKTKANDLSKPIKTRIKELKSQEKVVMKQPEVVSRYQRFSGLERLKTRAEMQPVMETMAEWATTPGKQLMKPMMRAVWTRGKGALVGAEEVPQKLEFYEKSITEPGTYKSATMKGMTKTDITKTGVFHGTRGGIKIYKEQGVLRDVFNKVAERTVVRPLSYIFNTTKNAIDKIDLYLWQTKYGDKIVLGGSSGIKLQSKMSLAKMRRFGFLKEITVDKDYIVRGGYSETVDIADDFAKVYTDTTGKPHTSVAWYEKNKVNPATGKKLKPPMHKGTATIYNSAGKRIRDFTSIYAPNEGILRGLYDVPISVRMIDGLPVRDLQSIIFDKVDITTLRGIKGGKLIEKAIKDIKIASGKNFPEMLLSVAKNPGDTIVYIRGTGQKLTEFAKTLTGKAPVLRSLIGRVGAKGEGIVGFSTRTTVKNPVQFQLYHMYPRGYGARWMLGLEQDIESRESVYRFGFTDEPRAYIGPKTEILKGKDLKALIKAGRKSENEYIKTVDKIVIARDSAGKPPVAMPTYKFIQMTADGSAAEAEISFMSGTVMRRYGWTPELGEYTTLKPEPTTKTGKAWKSYGDWWAKRRGFKQYVIDKPSGRRIPLIPEEVSYIPKGMSADISAMSTSSRIGLFTTSKQPTTEVLIGSTKATQPIAPRITAKHIMDDISSIGKGAERLLRRKFPEINFSSTSPLSDAQFSNITNYIRKEINVYYRPSYSYISRWPSLYRPYRETEREYERYQPSRPYSYKPPTYDFTYRPSRDYIPSREYDYDYHRPGYSYDYDYEYPYEETPPPYDYGGYDYPYPSKPRITPPILGMKTEERKEKEPPKPYQFMPAYKERFYDVPKIWKAGTRRPGWVGPKTPTKKAKFFNLSGERF